MILICPVVSCMICAKAIFTYYGLWGTDGTCSVLCEEKAEDAAMARLLADHNNQDAEQQNEYLQLPEVWLFDE